MRKGACLLCHFGLDLVGIIRDHDSIDVDLDVDFVEVSEEDYGSKFIKGVSYCSLSFTLEN